MNWLLIIGFLILGMLMANMLVNVCGCKNVVEGQNGCDPPCEDSEICEHPIFGTGPDFCACHGTVCQENYTCTEYGCSCGKPAKSWYNAQPAAVTCTNFCMPPDVNGISSCQNNLPTPQAAGK